LKINGIPGIGPTIEYIIEQKEMASSLFDLPLILRINEPFLHRLQAKIQVYSVTRHPVICCFSLDPSPFPSYNSIGLTISYTEYVTLWERSKQPKSLARQG